jgi:hypothetical protein
MYCPRAAYSADSSVFGMDNAINIQNMNMRISGLFVACLLWGFSLGASEVLPTTKSKASIGSDSGCVTLTDGLVGWWAGEENVADYLSGAEGVLRNGATYAPGKVGTAFSLTNGAYVEIPDSKNVNFTETQPMTVELWVYRTGLASGMHILSKRVGADSMEYQLAFDSETRGLHFIAGNPWNVVAVNAGVPLPLNTWWHLAATSDGTYLRLYTNGVLVGAVAGKLGPKNSEPLRIGAIDYYVPAPFVGLIDEVSLYNRALTASEIQNLYAAGSAGKCAAQIAPSIVSGPRNQSVEVGSSANFSVTAAGSYPLKYQWQWNGTGLANATNATLSLTNVQPSDEGLYSVVVVNDYGFTTSTDAVLQVNADPPSITAQPQSLSVNAGNSVSLSVKASGSGHLSYQWNFDGVALSGATNSVLKLANLQTNNAGIYSVMVYSEYGSVSSSNAVLSVLTYPPAIVTPPQSQLFVAGVNGSLPVVATGTSPLTYQWQFNGFDLAGASKATLVLTNIQSANAGNYAVIVSNPYGAITSAVAVLTVKQPPVISIQPVDLAIVANSNAGFSVYVTGDSPLAYQWYYNNTRINGETNNSIKLTNVSGLQNGRYYAVITNPYGAVTSRAATLEVLSDCVSAPVGLAGWWTAEGTTQDLVGGGVCVLKNGATYGVGKVGLAFSLTNGAYVEIPNASNVDYSTTNAMTVELWVYRTGLASGMHILSKRVGAGSMAYQLAFDSSTRGLHFIAGDPWDLVAVNTGASLPLNTWWHLAATSDGSMLKLYTNGVLAGEVAGTLGPQNSEPLRIGAIDSVTPYPFDGLIDEVSLYNRALNSNEISAIYAAGGAGKCVPQISPTILVQPVGATLDWGATTSLRVTAAGSAPLRYQWQFAGVNIESATNSVLNLTNVQTGNAGVYTVVVANDYGFVTSSNAVLIVNPQPSIITISDASFVAGKAVVPISLISRGNENAVGFSVSFNPAHLAFNGVVPSATAFGLSIIANSNRTDNGQLGLVISLPAGASFVAGTQQLVLVSFDVGTPTNTFVTSLVFGDQPTKKQVVGADSHLVAASFMDGTVTIPFLGYEGDVAPWPAGGDDSVTTADWVEIGRLVAGLDLETNGVILQRADCAPRATLGDGLLTVADWVQAGRYAVGLDPLTGAGGPSSAMNPAALRKGNLQARSAEARTLSILSGPAQADQFCDISVQLTAQADENGVEFSLIFDPAVLSFADGRLGGGAANANLHLNTYNAAKGQLGVVLVLPAGTTFAAATLEVVKLRFKVAAPALGHTAIAFANVPLTKQVVDAAADSVEVLYQDAVLAISPIHGDPSLKFTASGVGLAFTWPTWAGGYVLDVSTNLSLGGWTSIEGGYVTNETGITLTLPKSGTEPQKYYRLRFP